MWKFLSQYPRGAPFESPYNIVRRFLWRSLNKQVNVVRLNRQPQNRPSVLGYYFVTDFFQTLCHSTHQDLFASFRDPDEMVAHLIDRVISLFNFVRYHVDSLTCIDRNGKENVRFHPCALALGFPAPESYKLSNRF
jgi:hypothetical protein